MATTDVQSRSAPHRDNEEQPDLKKRINDYLDDERFHRTLTFPVSSTAGSQSDFTVTYSDFGSPRNEDGTQPNVILLCSPLFGSRYLHVGKDKVAKDHGIRIICPDRPGFGGTTDVDPQNRIKAWLDIVAALLRHLDIRHVSVVSHSGGTIYALNTILHMPHILHPTHPYVALCAPWIHPSHSGAIAMQITDWVPDMVLSRFDSVARFIVGTVNPISSPVSDVISKLRPKPKASADVEFEEALRPEAVARGYTENVHGLGEDAMLFFRRAKRPDEWGTWRDYDTFLPLLAAARETGGPERPPKLRVDVFFAESDIMIGTKVSGWFDECWRGEQGGDSVAYNSCVVEGSEHDTILDLRYGVPEKIFAASRPETCSQ